MVKFNTEMKYSGKGSFVLFGKYPTELISSRMFSIDMKRTYTLSAWLRSMDDKLPASAFMGLRMFDENKKPITIKNVGVINKTETTLSSDAKKGGKELQVAKNGKWLDVKHACVAFNAEPKYRDLPNYDLSSRIEKVIDEGEQYKIVLKNALRKDYPKGTRVRLHSPWGAPLYWVASGWMPAKWKKFAVTLKGEAHYGASSYQFWPGTKFARVFVWFGNYNKIPKKGARLLVDDIEFTSKPTKIIEILGHLKCSNKWSVFGPMSMNDALDEKQLKAIPNEICVNGKRFTAIHAKSVDNKIDFLKIYNSFPKNSVAYAFGTIETPEDGKVTLGMGADWWMKVWIDAKLVCDTTASGNGFWPPNISDHKTVITLNKGKHVVTVRFVGGTGSSVLAIAGPDQLRKIKK
ncbi:MAG: hypothetical protein KAG97_05605 [Victivallales bacterium]|nr:hypothetical protein [Victivallales bacterium]